LSESFCNIRLSFFFFFLLSIPSLRAEVIWRRTRKNVAPSENLGRTNARFTPSFLPSSSFFPFPSLPFPSDRKLRWSRNADPAMIHEFFGQPHHDFFFLSSLLSPPLNPFLSIVSSIGGQKYKDWQGQLSSGQDSFLFFPSLFFFFLLLFSSTIRKVCERRSLLHFFFFFLSPHLFYFP